MKKLILVSVKFYQKYLSSSPLSRAVLGDCRFSPSCSNYTYEAVERYGIIKGTSLGLKRILRCNPFSKGGFDPVK